ncbi:MAG: AAA family ATPase [Desulfobacterales bacterium]|nr:AAA family ATPase [Desulfobacterales bacterium]
MRLKRLDLKAFGPFTDRTLEFNSREPGLHIIFGPNEAGKSSSLRALKALLYGFPERTADNFQHANDQLLVGGCLQGADGRELAFLRRKKRKADLLDLDGNPMDPGMVAAFLHGIEPALFESLYGIDHKILVEGGEDILAQKGEVGQALFAAGAGISSLKKIQDSLDAEADELFKARGSKQRINQAIKEYKALKKTVKEESLPSKKWKEHKKRLQDAEAAQAGLEQESRQKGGEVRRLERLHRAIPELAELENLKKQLQQLGDVVLLPPEFSNELRQVEQEIRETRLQTDKDKVRLKRLATGQEGISLNQPLLDHAETIEDLHQRLGEYRKGLKDRSRLDGMRISNRKDGGALIREIRPDLTLEDAESLRPVFSRKRTIQALSSRHGALIQQASQARKQKDEAEKELGQIAAALSGRPAIRKNDGLAKALKPARRVGDIDQRIEEISREINAGRKSCRAELKRLGLWSGELDQLPGLTLPLPETVRRFETLYSVIENERQQLKKDRKKAEAELKTARTDNREVAYGGEVPTERNLEESRNKRQQGWRLLRRQWIDGKDISKEAKEYAPGRAVYKAYEKNVAQADHIADRLRREAERVAKAASLRARIEGLEETIKEISRQERESADRAEELAAAWRAQWESIQVKPLSPKEMFAWLTDIDSLRVKLTEILNKEAELREKDRARQHYRKLLAEELKALGENQAFPGRELTPVLVLAESVLEDIALHRTELDKLYDRQAQVRTALARAQKEQEAAAAARADWQEKWDKALAGLGLRDQVLPEEALDLLDTINDCFDKLEKAREFQGRINGIDRDVDKFSGDVQTLVAQVAPDLKDLSPDQAVLQLHTMLGKARQDHELLKKTSEEIEGLAAEIENGEKTLQSLDGRMAGLLATARCDKVADLAGAVRKSGEYQRLREKIAAAESSLAKISDGISLEEIKRQADEVDVDELPGWILILKRQIDEELYPGITDILKLIGEENRELQLMDGSARAAEAAEKMERVGAGIRRLVDQYTRIKLAAMVLKDEIERYREEHQDPVLKIASRYFADLTLGSFAGLRTDVDDNGNPILVGVRPDKSRLTVGAMSSGTRDQLFLGLRLASLEWRLENSEPMPFIVDDILINFDDERSRATLRVLADLSEKNQVILFTHHGRIVETAREMKVNSVYVHEL